MFDHFGHDVRQGKARLLEPNISTGQLKKKGNSKTTTNNSADHLILMVFC